MREQSGVDRPNASIAGALLLLGISEAVLGDVHRHHLAALTALSAIAVSMLWRTSRPFVPVVVVAAAIIGQTATGVPLNATITAFVAVVLASYSAGAHLPTAPAVFALCTLTAAGMASVLLDHRSVAANVPFAFLICAAPWAVGIRNRRRRRYTSSVERQRDAAEERAAEIARQAAADTAAALAAERARIARELHDVVAHTLTVIGLQAGGARRLLRPDQDRERAALLIVEQASRQAHADMGRLLQLVRHEPEGLAPQPGLADLSALVDTVREAGLDVDYVGPDDDTSRPLLGSGAELAVYRIVQEALTNVRRHADATRVAVRVASRPEGLTVEVIDNGTASRGRVAGGFGLVGMQERVGLYGGRLEVGFVPEGGFRVSARIPFDQVRA